MKITRTTYELWQPDPRYQLPPRSTLARLEPIGLDGPFVESLSSYYLRLAHLHRLSPLTLANYLITPKVQNSTKAFCKTKTFYWNLQYFNGVDNTASLWSKQLEKLTGFDYLDQLTFCSLNFLLPTRQLIAPEKRWCPFCYEESYNKHQIYDQLLWDVDTVTACPKHRIRLVENCTCDPKSSLHLINARRLPGFCRRCGGKLFDAKRSDIESAEEHEVQRAKLVADFIAHRAIISNFELKDNFGIVKFMRGVISEHTDGYANRFGKLLFISKSKLSEWLNGHHIPVFPQVVNIAQVCNCSIVDVYLGNHKKVNKVEPLYSDKRKEISIPHKGNGAFKRVTEATMKNYLEQEIPMNMRQVAEELNVNMKYLRKHFGKYTAQIVKNYQKFIKEKSETRFKEMVRLYSKTAKSLLKRGIKPTHNKVINELDHPMDYLRNRKIFKDIIKEVVKGASQLT